VGPLVRLAFSTESPVRGRRKRKGKKEGEGKETFSAQFLLAPARMDEAEDDGMINSRYKGSDWENFRKIGSRQQVSMGQ